MAETPEPKPAGDTIAARVGNAENVVVGKDNVQINVTADTDSITRLIEEGRAARTREQGGRLRWGVTALPRHYVPRQAELARLRKALAGNGAAALTAVEGMGGVGKSTLAAAMADDPACAQRYADGVLWGNLGPEARDEAAADAVLIGWGAALGFAETITRPPSASAPVPDARHHPPQAGSTARRSAVAESRP